MGRDIQKMQSQIFSILLGLGQPTSHMCVQTGQTELGLLTSWLFGCTDE